MEKQTNVWRVETTDEKKTWNWLIKADLKVEMEAMLCRAGTGNLNKLSKTDKTAQSPICKMCDKKKQYLRMYGQFVREIQETTDEKETCNWLKKADLKVEMEAMLWVLQEQAIWIN